MPALECANCGATTNTAVSNHLFPVRSDKKAHECYAKWVNEKWVEGCGFKDADEHTKKVIAAFLRIKNRIVNEPSQPQPSGKPSAESAVPIEFKSRTIKS